MAHALVICIGNVARGDDGVAHRVAALLDGRLPAGTQLVTAPQLDIAMADGLTDDMRVVIVDAERRATPAVDVRAVEAAPHGEYGHALSPGHLLDIAFSLYAARPKMSLVTLAAPFMEHDMGLSAVAEAAAEEGAETVLRLLGGQS
jgi:hydrogenase maturation protease